MAETKKKDATAVSEDDSQEDAKSTEEETTEDAEESTESADEEATEDEGSESDDDSDDDDSEDEEADEDADEDDATEVTGEQLDKMISSAVKKAVRAEKRAGEKTKTKKIGAAKVIDNPLDKYEKMSPAQRTVRHFKAYLENDRETLKGLTEYSFKVAEEWDDELRRKAGYANEGVAADGSVLVPPADFVAEVARLESEYGVARDNGVRTRTVSSNAATIRKKTGGGLQFVETNEAAAKTGVKMAFQQQTVTLRKFAAIAPVTDELSDDAAVDIFNELTTDFARAKGFQDDVLVFTDSTTGIIHQSGLAKAVSVDATTLSGHLTFDHVISAIYATPNQVQQSANAKFYAHRGAYAVLLQIKDNYGRYILQPDPTQPGKHTLYGYPLVLTEVLGGGTAGSTIAGVTGFSDQANTTYLVFGDLSNSLLIDKGGLELTMLTEGTITGSDSSTINLAQQDMKALRGVYRSNNVVQFPLGFSTIGTGTVS